MPRVRSLMHSLPSVLLSAAAAMIALATAGSVAADSKPTPETTAPKQNIKPAAETNAPKQDAKPKTETNAAQPGSVWSGVMHHFLNAANVPKQDVKPATETNARRQGGEPTGTMEQFLAVPNKENFTALQNRVVADRKYDATSQGLAEIAELYHRKSYADALAHYEACLPDLLLSPQAHLYAARCQGALGHKDEQIHELALARACLQGLLATGDGSPERPFVVTHPGDEYDLLAAPLATESKSQSLMEKNGRMCDVLECANGKTYWFDVSLVLGHGGAASNAVTPIAKANRPTPSAAAAKPAQKPAPVAENDSRNAALTAYDQGTAALQRREFDRAIADFDEVLRFDPKCADALFQRGIARLEMRDATAAVGDFTAVIRLRPADAQAYYQRGMALSQTGNKSPSDAALADFAEAVHLTPSNFVFWRSRAVAWFARQEYQRAIDDDSQALRLAPDDVTACVNRGFAYESLGQWNKAIADFDAAIRLQPQSAQAYAGRGIAWFNLGQHESAIADLNEAIRLQPDYAAAYEYRGKAYAQTGDELHAHSDAGLAASLRAGGR